jgi:phenylalanyl-tRNA synthetase beta chain
MPTVTLNRKEFEKLIGKKLSLEKLKDRISMIGTDLEEVNDNEIIVEVFPNRPDMLSEQGFARAFSTFIGARKGLKEYTVKNSEYKVIIDKSVKDIRPYTACAVVKGLSLNDEKIRELIQIQEKLHITYGRKRKKAAIGIYPIEHIKFPITFKADLPENIRFKPLGENKEMNAKEILNENSTGKEYKHLLENYPKYPFFVDSNNNILSMPPIINSELAGRITESTKDVFVECSGFDFEILKKTLNIIVTAMADMGGEIYEVKVEYDNQTISLPNLKPEEFKLDENYINKRLGLSLSRKEIIELLMKMGFGYNEEKQNILVPAYRTDILHQIDFVEDVAIAYGYENFEPIISETATVGEESKIEVFKNKIAELLVGLGFLEVNTYNLSNEYEQGKKMNKEINVVKLRNALSEEYNALRAWVIPSLMDVLNKNRQYKYPQQIFGFGRVFKKNENTETGIEEADRLALAIIGNNADFTRTKQILEYIFSEFNIGDYEFIEEEHSSFIPGRVARVKVKGTKIAYIGEIHPIVLQNFELEYPVAVFEINISKLFDFLN